MGDVDEEGGTGEPDKGEMERDGDVYWKGVWEKRARKPVSNLSL